MIRYDRLWDTMTNRGMTQYKLIKFHGFSAGQIGRLKKICTFLLTRLKHSAAF